MTHPELDALCEAEPKLDALRDGVIQTSRILNAHDGVIEAPELDGALQDAFKLGWKAREQLYANYCPNFTK